MKALLRKAGLFYALPTSANGLKSGMAGCGTGMFSPQVLFSASTTYKLVSGALCPVCTMK